ncbi:hypothetical protein [Megalodesulfovibrio paquesii]
MDNSPIFAVNRLASTTSLAGRGVSTAPPRSNRSTASALHLA